MRTTVPGPPEGGGVVSPSAAAPPDVGFKGFKAGPLVSTGSFAL